MSRTTRRPYTGSKRFDASCRSHGSCPHCQFGRQRKSLKNLAMANDQMADYHSASNSLNTQEETITPPLEASKGTNDSLMISGGEEHGENERSGSGARATTEPSMNDRAKSAHLSIISMKESK